MSSHRTTGRPGRSGKGAHRVISRRGLLAAGIAAPFVVPRHVLGAGYQAPSDTLAIAAVGVGGMGRNYLAGCRGERVVALCDLDHKRSAGVFKRYATAKQYHDFRKMFDKEAKRFDALIVGTPDHTHTVILMAALQLGNKHVYCAKPITHSIGEARKVREAFLGAGKLVTKSSVQSSGSEAARSTTELFSSGVIGPVRELHIWCNHPIYPCSLLRPTQTQSPPPGMDWDLWIGPAPFRPYHSAYHPFNWRPWWDFGSGTVGDMGCHTFHVYFRELRLGAPATVYGYGSTRHKGIIQPVATPECQSHANMVTWEFPARGDLPPLAVHWYDGGMKPHRPPELDRSIQMPLRGLLFVGEKGKLLADYGGGDPFRRGTSGQVRSLAGGMLLPEDEFQDFQQPPKTMPRCTDHYLEWTQACKQGTRTVCPIEFGCEMTEMALLGALALRTGRVLRWDAAAGRVTDDPDANRLVDPPYRKGWTL